MRLRDSLALLMICSCATTLPTPPTVLPEHRIEEEPLPVDPDNEKLPGPQEEWVEPLEAGSCVDQSGKFSLQVSKPCPLRSGISMSEAKAARFGLYKIRYRELRTSYEADRKVVSAQRALYETRLQLADKAIQNLQPGFWDVHKGEISLIGGFILGITVAGAVGILAK